MLWLIDFEYSGNNDPTFELGNTCQEQQFDEARLVEMCVAYFGAAGASASPARADARQDGALGGPHPDKLARMKLNMIMSDVGWTLWAAIQAKISTIDFDFWGWAVERWGRAAAKMDAPEFEKWLEDVRRGR
jgi:thiamine kinase-like enzyme